MSAVKKKPPKPIASFVTQKAFRAWLAKNHASSQGIWLQLARKTKVKVSGAPSLTYAQALDVALCFGWIDGQKKAHDASAWLQMFTPRGPRSIWSKLNRDHVERLEESGEMQPSGARAVALAKEDGRWDRAYDSPKSATVPEDCERRSMPVAKRRRSLQRSTRPIATRRVGDGRGERRCASPTRRRRSPPPSPV